MFNPINTRYFFSMEKKMSILLLLFYLTLNVEVYFQETQAERKAEIQFGQFHQTSTYDLKNRACCQIDGISPPCASICNRTSNVYINGVLLQTEVFDKTSDPLPSMLLDNQYQNETEHPELFKNELNVSIVVTMENNPDICFFKYSETFQVPPNQDFADEDHASNLNLGGKFNVFIRYSCVGYTGYQCQFKCTDGEKYYCDFDDGKPYCATEGLEPPECVTKKIYPGCNPNLCLNGGECSGKSDGSFYCDCVDNYYGDLCQHPNCTTECNIDHGECVGPNICKCNEGFGGSICENAVCVPGFCLNKGRCFIKDNVPRCECNADRFCGDKCEFECTKMCRFGECYKEKDEKEAKCRCLSGFEGEVCDTQIPTMKPTYDKQYYTPAKQKLAYSLLAIGLIALAVILFGIGVYIRKKKQTNITVEKMTKTLTMNMNKNARNTLVADMNKFA